nr:MAG TPA: hypothetical protein [Caudoviricetes sp.]
MLLIRFASGQIFLLYRGSGVKLKNGAKML